MDMIRRHFLLALIIAISAISVTARTTYNFNSDWRLFVGDPASAEAVSFDDSSWKSVTTPHSWNEDDAFRKDIKDLSTGIAWYRKHFKLPADSRYKKVFIEFEGIRFAGEFYLNGKFIGRHENGITAFGFDISNDLVENENVIAVRTDNSWDYKEKATGSAFQWNAVGEGSARIPHPSSPVEAGLFSANDTTAGVRRCHPSKNHPLPICATRPSNSA